MQEVGQAIRALLDACANDLTSLRFPPTFFAPIDLCILTPVKFNTARDVLCFTQRVGRLNAPRAASLSEEIETSRLSGLKVGGLIEVQPEPCIPTPRWKARLRKVDTGVGEHVKLSSVVVLKF